MKRMTVKNGPICNLSIILAELLDLLQIAVKMQCSRQVLTCPLPPSLAWQSLLNRSLEAWETLSSHADANVKQRMKEELQYATSLDDFLTRPAHHAMFWFFQRREAFLSQQRMTKWSRDALDDYVLLPAIRPFVNRSDCFFVSHFWHSSEHPDPHGEYLCLLQADMERTAWLYIWVDWTCIPQNPRTQSEAAYFLRSLETVSSIIRNSGFMYYYPPFEPRMWILYEIAEFTLTCSEGIAGISPTADVNTFLAHIQEMLDKGVRSVLHKHKYKCTYERDMEFLTS